MMYGCKAQAKAGLCIAVEGRLMTACETKNVEVVVVVELDPGHSCQANTW